MIRADRALTAPGTKTPRRSAMILLSVLPGVCVTKVLRPHPKWSQFDGVPFETLAQANVANGSRQQFHVRAPSSVHVIFAGPSARTDRPLYPNYLTQLNRLLSRSSPNAVWPLLKLLGFLGCGRELCSLTDPFEYHRHHEHRHRQRHHRGGNW